MSHTVHPMLAQGGLELGIEGRRDHHGLKLKIYIFNQMRSLKKSAHR